MRRLALLVFTLACHSQEQQQVAPIASASETPAVSAAPSVTAAPVVSAVVDGTGAIEVDASKHDDKEAERRARMEREIAAQMVAILGAPSDGGRASSILKRDDVPMVDLSSVAVRSYDAGGGGSELRVGTARGGSLVDIRNR